VYIYRKISEYNGPTEVIPLVASEPRRPRSKRRFIRSRLRRKLVTVAQNSPASHLFSLFRRKTKR
jgi:hypothetical protein